MSDEFSLSSFVLVKYFLIVAFPGFLDGRFKLELFSFLDFGLGRLGLHSSSEITSDLIPRPRTGIFLFLP